MAEVTFQIFKVSDRELLSALSLIAQQSDPSHDASLELVVGQQHNRPIKVRFSEIGKNPLIQKILAAESSIISQATVVIPSISGCRVIVSRGEPSDRSMITCPDNVDPSQWVDFLTAAHKHLHSYQRTESTDKLLGDELAEFYRKRESALLRLEDLTQKLISQNEEYRQHLDHEASHTKESLQKEHQSKLEELRSDYEQRAAKLKEREDALDERVRHLDDRDSKHARRQLRTELKEMIKHRESGFGLTADTVRKRKPTEVLFGTLVLAAIGLFAISLWQSVSPPSDMDTWYLGVHLATSAAALAAALIYFIRWYDHWFRQHADEEFRLKRLELDIDRASWVLEMALEWNKETGSQLPAELIDRLTSNLFTADSHSKAIRHPSEDLASALLGASSGLAVKVPGVGEATLDRKAVKDFKKAAAEHGDE